MACEYLCVGGIRIGMAVIGTLPFCSFTYGSIGENTLYRDLEANWEIQQVYIPIANDVFGILTE